ncbi:MAG: hypothetical protein RL754_868 [Bacteroidota bacterium]
MTVHEIITKGHEVYVPNLSVDTVIFGYENGKLKCLLLKMGSRWMLPGGFVGKTEAVQEAAERIVLERTGIENPHLKFLSVCGSGTRSFKEDWDLIFPELGLKYDPNSWLIDRFVSLVHYSLLYIPSVNPKVTGSDTEAAWFPVDELPTMWFDHAQTVRQTRESLRVDVKLEQIAHHLLAKEFTMPQLHEVHQVILGMEVDRSRFQKKMLSLEIFERLEKNKVKSPGRNPYLYREIVP